MSDTENNASGDNQLQVQLQALLPSLLPALSAAEIGSLIPFLQEKKLSAGHILMTQGAPDCEIYFLLDGAFVVFEKIRINGSPLVLMAPSVFSIGSVAPSSLQAPMRHYLLSTAVRSPSSRAIKSRLALAEPRVAINLPLSW